MKLFNFKNKQSKEIESEKNLRERCIQYALQTRPGINAEDVCKYSEQYYKYISIGEILKNKSGKY